MFFERKSKLNSNLPPWQAPREIWSNQEGFDQLYARLDQVKESLPEVEYVMQDRFTKQHWLLTCNGRLGDKIAPTLKPITWPLVIRRQRETWIDSLIDAWRGPPWVQPRNVWQDDKHFSALRERLDYVRDLNSRDRLYRDRETGQLWRLCAVDGGGDMFPGTVDCFEPSKEPPEL